MCTMNKSTGSWGEVSLQPFLPASDDSSFYFSDSDYNDYRELICYERPVCFTLHYYFGFKTSRLWLFDRFAFELLDGRLAHRKNALADFFFQSGLVSCERR